MIIQRGRDDVYEALAADLGAAGQAVVIWDRRLRDRRRPEMPIARVPERRGESRRRPPPDTWSLFGFVLVHPD